MSAPVVRLHRPPPALLQAIDMVLVSTSHPGNVGACARAMRVMGLHHLLLVAPRLAAPHTHPEAIARASGAGDVLAATRVYPSLAEALAPHTLAIAVSAEVREFGPPPAAPEAIADEVLALLRAGSHCRVAFVFGAERTGLSIAEVQQCQRLCSIPGDPQYNSLNLAQAVQVISYVLRRRAEQQPLPDAPLLPLDAAATPGALGDRATLAQLEGFYDHLQAALIAVGYLDPAAPKKLMPRLRRLFGRAGLEHDEVNLLRGVFQAMLAQAHTRRKPPDQGP